MKDYLVLFLIIFISCEDERIVIIEDTGTLPKVCISVDEQHLWSPDSGLYVIGSNGKEMCGQIANYNQKWEFPASIKLIEHGEQLFDEKVGLRIKGGCSRSSSMKSIGIYWRGEYGNKKLSYPIFEESSINSYKRLFIRNSGNDFGETQIKDISINSIIKGYANIETQEYKQCVVYLNEEYWGIYNIREMLTKHYFAEHFGYGKENIDLLEGSELNPSADDGNTNDYMNNVANFILSNDLSNINNYNHIANLIDIESYIDYIIVNTYIGNRDWPQNNIKWWKDRTVVDSKWRWVLFDTDLSLELSRVERVWIGNLIGQPINEDEGLFFIFNNLLKNKAFIQIFLNRYLYFIENVFEEERVASLIIRNKNNINIEYNNFRAKWKVLNKSQWENEVEKMITFNIQRNQIMKKVIEKLQHDNN